VTARLLIVDDVAPNARLLEARLAAEYYVVATAQSGPEALLLAASWRPDTILLKVVMPGMDGFEVCRRLKADSATSHVPVVMVTALGEPAERMRGLDAGADDFLTKPVEFDTLLARVRGLVRLKRMLDEWQARSQTACSLGRAECPVEVPTVGAARVLVIDDLEPEATLVQEWLAREEMLPRLARTEAELQSLLRAAGFDLIVLSLSLASDDALALASWLRSGEETSEIPLLLIAEPESRARVLRGFDLGANDWLLRPVEEYELRARARNQVRRKIYHQHLRADLDHASSLALTDPLTGLYNQRYVVHHLRHRMAGPQRVALAVLLIDLDHFKRVNESYGHPVGDRALQAVTETLRANLRIFDTLARYGGETFVVVMPGASIGEAAGAGERLRDAVAQMRFVPDVRGMPHRLTVSIGVVSSERADGSAEGLLQAAEAALEGAKREGRNRVELAGPK